MTAVDERTTVRTYAADVALLAASAVAALMTHYRTYHRWPVVALAVCVAALAWAVWRGAGWQAPRRATVAVGLLIALAGQAFEPPHLNAVVTGWLWTAVWLSAAVTVLAVGTLLAAAGTQRRLAGGVLAGTGVAWALVVVGSPVALIDVWVILQGAALDLWHGVNPYATTFGDVPAGQVNDCFNYLPFTFAGPSLTRMPLGDVRYFEAAVMFAGVVGLAVRAYRLRSGPAVALPLALTVGLLAGSLHDVQQAWNETMLAGLLIGAALLADRWTRTSSRGAVWAAAACFGIALATKQHVALLLPLLLFWPAFGWRRTVGAGVVGGLVCLPWYAADPGRFTHCTVAYFLDLPAREDSLSIWHWLPEHVGTPLLLLTALLAYVLAVTRLPKDGAGLLLGFGLILGGWDLVNKQSFLNQWLLVAQLVVAGLALAASRTTELDEAPAVPDRAP